MAKWDAIIVGAGISGLCAGALLAKAGKRVLVLEKEKELGGRAFSTTYKGHVLDNGAHAPLLSGHLEEVFSRLGKPFPRLGPFWARTEVYEAGQWQEVTSLLVRQELRQIVGEIRATSYEELEKHDDMSLEEWVTNRSDNPGIHRFFWHFGMMLTGGNRYEPISAGKTLLLLKEFLERRAGLAGMLAPIVGGTSSILPPLAEAIKEKGGEVRTGARVSEIIIHQGRARGVEVESGERLHSSQIADVELIEASLVICTLPLWDLFRVISRDALPGWYVDWIEYIKDKFGSVWTLTVGLKEPLWDQLIARWVPRLPHAGLGGIFVTMPTYGEAVGEYQTIFFMQANYDDVPNIFHMESAQIRRQVRRLFDLLEKDIRELFPDFEKRCLWKVRHVAPFSLAETPGLVGRFQPPMQPPGVTNLYLVSDTIREARGVGMQGAALGALHCASRILPA